MFVWHSEIYLLNVANILRCDAVVKCLATAVATGTLLYLSPLIFGTKMTPLTVPGGLIVFISSYLYLISPVPKRPTPEGLSENPQITETRSSKFMSLNSVS